MDCLCPFSKIIKLLPSVPRESSGAHRLGSLFVLDGWHGEWSRKDAGLFANFQGQISFFEDAAGFANAINPYHLFQFVFFRYFNTCFFPLSIPVCILRLMSCSRKGKRTLHPPPTFLFGTFRMDLQSSVGDSGE